MKISKLLLAGVLAFAGLTASAQETETVLFKPHWFLQLQGGGVYNLDKADFDKLVSPAAQVAVGYQFSPVWALRLGANGMWAKGGLSSNDTYKWKYVTPALDVKFNLINAICGYKPTRVFGLDLIAGVGANIGWDNEGNGPVFSGVVMENYWEGTKVRPVGRLGFDLDFNVSKRVSINLECMANALSDKYNSRADNAHDIDLDWYFTGLAGLKIALGSTQTVIPAPVPVVVEEPAPAPVVKETPRTAAVEVAPEIQTEIFYYIRQTEIRPDQQPALNNLINFLKENPETKVAITGYADVETGNPRINMKYSEGRAEGVRQALIDAGIDAARITTDAKGDTVQPFSENDKNRVSICIAK